MRRKVLLATVVAVYLLVSVGCNGSKSVDENTLSPPTDRLSLAIEDVQTQAAPVQVEKALWELLSDELVRALELRRDSEQRTSSMLVPPTNIRASAGVLTWTQRLVGDYDNNGEVNVADLAAIAIHYGETVDPATPAADFLVRIDGDDNGEINLGDVAPIAIHFGEVLSAYGVIYSETAGGAVTDVAQLPRNSHADGIGNASPGYSYRVSKTGFFSVSPRGVGQTAASRSESIYCEFTELGSIDNNSGDEPIDEEEEEEQENPVGDNPVPGVDSLLDQLDNLQIAALEGEGYLTGRVIDPDGMGVGSATIVVPGVGQIVSNEEGYFAIPDVDSTARMPIDVICPGYTLGTELVRVDGSRERFFTITLLPVKASKYIDFDKGGQIIEPQTGARIVFSPGDIVDGAGEVITGYHLVSISPVDVTDNAELDSVPGRLEGGETDGSLSFLQTFGMMEIFVDDGLGNKCNVAPERYISISIPIPVATRPIAPASVGLYSFDEVTAIWIEEGTMLKSSDGTKYLANISHLSWWNPDRPSEIATMAVKVMDENNTPMPNVSVDYYGLDYQGSWRSTTNQEGVALLRVRTNSMISLNVNLLDNQVGYSENLSTPSVPDTLNPDPEIIPIEIGLPIRMFDCSGTLLWGANPLDLDIVIINNIGGKSSMGINKELGHYFNTRDEESYGPEKVTFWYAPPGIYSIYVLNQSGQDEFPIEESQATFQLSRPNQGNVGVLVPGVNPGDHPLWHVMNVTIQEDRRNIAVEIINEYREEM